MVDWKSPTVIAENGADFLKVMHVLFGVYMWEWLVSLDFDWQLISGKRKLRYPMVFYLLNRYFLLIAHIGLAMALNLTHKVNCQALYTFIQILGSMVIGLVSINLSIRTMAVWGQVRYIVVPLIIIIIGHWAVLLRGIFIKSAWNPQGGGCVLADTHPKILLAGFIYSMCFDFLLLCLTGYKLHVHMSGMGLSRLARLIFHDGLVYFIAVFLANTVAVVFLLLDLNPTMSVIGSAPAAVVSTIVVCRAIRRLANYKFVGADVYYQENAGPLHQTIPRGRRNAATGAQSISLASTGNGGVQIQMHTSQEYDVPTEPKTISIEYKSSSL